MNKKQQKVYDWLISSKGYMKKSPTYIYLEKSDNFTKSTTLDDITIALNEARLDSAIGQLTNKKKAKPIHEKGPRMIEDKSKFRRLFFDIETSYNIVKSWRVGFKINLNPSDIVHERAIICVSWKWAGSPKIYNLKWDDGDDKNLLKEFVKVMDSADEVVGHNGDRFDIKWLRTRCLINNIPMAPEYKSVDTLKLAKAGFNFNSNRLDYLGQVMGVGKKIETGGLSLWDKIVLPTVSGGKSDPASMKKMVKYCNGDIDLLEKVYDKMNTYTKGRSHVGVIQGGDRCSCPSCGGTNPAKYGVVSTFLGTTKQRLKCKDCHKMYSVLMTTWNKYNKLNMK